MVDVYGLFLCGRESVVLFLLFVHYSKEGWDPLNAPIGFKISKISRVTRVAFFLLRAKSCPLYFSLHVRYR